MNAMRVQQMTVTPAQAREWLASNNVLNRNLRHRLVDKYAADMRSGKWHHSHQGIAFYDDGSLADGQHRLAAVVRAQVSIVFLVVFDLPRDSAIAIDQHAQRKMEDALRIGGAPSWIDKDVIAIVRFMAGQASSKAQLSADQIQQYAMTFESQLRFVSALVSTKKRNLTTSGVSACYVLALLSGENEQDIREFSEVMRTGEIDGHHQSAAIRLREFLLMNASAWNGIQKLGTTKRAQRAIHAFCRKQPLSRLYEPDEWVYPFPALNAVVPTFVQHVRQGTRKLAQSIIGTKDAA